ANLTGGAASDALVRRLGLKWGRRSLGIAGLGSACLCTIAAMVVRQQLITVILLSLVYGGDYVPAGGRFRRLPGYRTKACGIDGRADEHIGPSGRSALDCGIRVPRRRLPQL